MEKKYQLTDETREYEGRTLHRIQALRNFGDVKAGDFGGWVEDVNNLFHNGPCWVYDDAMVYDDVLVMDLSFVLKSAIVQDSAVVSGDSIIGENAIIKSNAYVFNTFVGGNTVIGKNGYIISRGCYVAVENIGSRHDTTTFYLDKDKNIWVNTGCFNDTLEAFEKVVVETHGNNQFTKEYFKAIEFAKFKLKENN